MLSSVFLLEYTVAGGCYWEDVWEENFVDVSLSRKFALDMEQTCPAMMRDILPHHNATPTKPSTFCTQFLA